MKKTFALFLILGMGFSLLITSCGDENDDPKLVDEAEGPVTGFLITTGLTRVGAKDTLVYWQTSSNGEMREYIKGGQDHEERITLTPLANGICSIERTVPYVSNDDVKYGYFGFNLISIYAGYPPGFDYRYTLRSSFTADCEFIRTKHETDPDKFYLESKLYPGYFLSPEKYKGASYPTETDLVLGSDKQWFSIVQE